MRANREQLTQRQGLELVDVRVQVHVAARAILARGRKPKNMRAVGAELIEEVERESAGVFGNRPGNVGVTWDDARLLLAATLRNCLNLLEGER